MTTIYKTIKSKRDAIAQHLSLDIAEVEDYRYHYGHTTQPVYAFTSSYYCATKMNQRPAKHRDGMAWEWVEVKDDYVNRGGYKIWKSVNTI